MPDVHIVGAHKRFGDVEAVRGVDLHVADRALCALIGPSGSGKSTLLRLVAGVEPLTSGRIAIGTRVVDALEPAERGVAMVTQDHALYPNLNVRENLAFGLPRGAGERAQVGERVREAAAALGLDQVLESMPASLTGAQRQFVAIGRAIVRKPRVLLLDNPLSSLDANTRTRLRAELVALHRRLRATSIVATDDPIEALAIGDAVAVMRDGMLAQSGTPDEIYDRPANTFVAGFVGSPAMNLLPARVGFDGRSIDVGRATIPVPEWNAPPGAEVVFGVRPEHLRPGGDGLRARIAAANADGLDLLLVGECDAGPVVARFSPSSLGTGAAHTRRPKPGETLTLVPDPHALHVFDAVSGRRI